MKLSVEEWNQEGIKRYGKDKTKWIFKCPNCGHLQTFNDYLELGISEKEASKVIGFSCIGRKMKDAEGEIFNKKSPCNYAGGGLFRLNPITVYDEKIECQYFDFADSLIKEKGCEEALK